VFLYTKYKSLRQHYKNLKLIWNTYGSFEIIRIYLGGIQQNQKTQKKYKSQKKDFLLFTQSLQLSKDWFSGNIPCWLSIIDEYDLRNKHLKALEIGSWEGLSSYFLLSTLSKAHLTCVDTWQGADEHKNGRFATNEVLSQIERNFDKNLKPFSDRLSKYRGTSSSFYEKNVSRCVYDFIYVDGSHHCDDVMVDAVKCFEMLKIGGIMVFDDYLWVHYPRIIDNPAASINLFLKLKKGAYKIICMGYQVIIRKEVDRYQTNAV